MKISAQIFVILVNGNFQTCRGEWDAAIEVRDNFNEMFVRNQQPNRATIVRGVVSFDPAKPVTKL